MFKNILLIFTLIFYIWISHNSVKAKIDPTSAESLNCDNSYIESNIVALKTDNEFFKLRFEMLQHQLKKQEEFFQNLDTKIFNIPQSLQSAEKKILARSQEHYDELYNLIRSRYQQPPVDEKLNLIIDIKELLKDHDGLLKSVNERIQNIEKNFEKTHLETRQLSNSVVINLTIFANINKTLTDIKSTTATKSDQKELNQYIQTYLNKTEANRQSDQKDLNPYIQTYFNRSEANRQLVCTNSTSPYPTSCADHNPNYCANNKCRIFNQIYGPKPFYVSCDNQNYGGGWTVIQRRINGSVDFYRDWSEYKVGFGNIEGEFFIGLEKLYALTTALQPMELLIELKDFNDNVKYAKYDEFIVEDELKNYKLLKVGKCSGNATDSFSHHQGYMFSTKDRDNDVSHLNCAVIWKAGWWFRKCFFSNLNGKYYAKEDSANAGICWNIVRPCDHSLKFVQMMIRPRKI